MNKSDLQATLTALIELQSEGPKLEKLGAETTAELTALENSCRLDDEKALTKITRLKILSNLLPRRHAAWEVAFAKAEEAGVQSGGAFVSDVLGKRHFALLAKARAKVKTALEGHFEAGPELDDAVERSAIVAELRASSPTIEAKPGDGAVGYARRLLAQFAALDAIEAKLS